MTATTLVKAHNPLWDGDGVQGAGQPRDRRGRWINLPGPSGISRIAAFDLDDGTIGVFVDNERRPRHTYKSQRSANKRVEEAIREDVREHKNAQRRRQRYNKKIRDDVESSRAVREVARAQRDKDERARQRREEKIVGTPKPIKGKPEGVPQLGPKPRADNRVTVSENEQLPNPGIPTQQQMDALRPWLRENFSDSEAKYAQMLGRLLIRRGVTQDPKVRGEMSNRYGSSPKRLLEVEQMLHERLFPKNQKKQRRVDYKGGAPVTQQQISMMQKVGARQGIPEANPADPKKPSRYVKITKGPQRGKWAKVSWNGGIETVSAREGKKAQAESRAYWTKKNLENKKANEVRRQKYRAAQNALRDMDTDDKKRVKEEKIKQAQSWAESEGLDPDDSYWWGFFWNDPSLVSEQHDQTSTPMSVGLSALMERSGFDPSLLEGLLAMPDMDARDMRGHRPGSRRAVRGDEDFEEASASSRTDSPEWEERNRARSQTFDRRMRMRYEAYKKKHPKSKKTIGEFANDYYNQKSRIPGGGTTGLSKAHNPLWDGDGVQGAGQPRGAHGRWSGSRAGSALGAAARSLDLADERAPRHTGTGSRRAGSKNAGAFDHRAKSIGQNMKIKKPQKGSSHQVLAAGVPVRRGRKTYSPESAYYGRNNGPTAIDNKRLKVIYENRSKITTQEHDLIMAAAGDVQFDGDSPITIRSVRHGMARREMPRYSVIKNLRTQLAKDYADKHNLGDRGERGHRRFKQGEAARAQNEKDNQKRQDNGRYIWENIAKRRQLLEDFGSDGRAKCIFCGRWVTEKDVSPERMMPGGIGGKYEKGNVAPAHARCNTNMGNDISAQYRPEEYYDRMLQLFEKRYADWIEQGYMDFVYRKHRSKIRRNK